MKAPCKRERNDVATCNATIKLLLRRTLVRLVMLLGKVQAAYCWQLAGVESEESLEAQAVAGKEH